MSPLEDEPFTLTSEPSSIGFSAKDEMNLAEFPIALVTDRAPAKDKQKTLRFEDQVFDESKGQHVTRRLVVTASDAYGLPTAKDDEVILGLVQLTRHDNNFTDRTVKFSRSDLIRLLAWPDTGPSYRRLGLSFNRWLGVSLHYHNAWWDKSQGRWTTLGFHIIESFKLTGGRGPGQLEFPLSRFTWNDDVFRSFQAGYLKRIDLDFYLGLSLPTAKRIYRFLDKRFYHRSEWTFDLREFALDHVGLSRGYEGNTQLSRKLQPAIQELEEKGFLVPLAPEARFQKLSTRDWKVVFIQQGCAESIREPSGPTAAEAQELASALTDRGVTGRPAEELAAAFPDRIRHKVEVFDWMRARKDRRIQRSPAGYLVNSIREDYADPQGFESAAEKARIREVEVARVRQAEEAKRRREAEEAAREQRDRARVGAYWEALAPDAQERLWREALEHGGSFYVQQYRRCLKAGEGGEKRYRDFLLHAHILKMLKSGEAGAPPPHLGFAH